MATTRVGGVCPEEHQPITPALISDASTPRSPSLHYLRVGGEAGPPTGQIGQSKTCMEFAKRPRGLMD